MNFRLLIFTINNTITVESVILYVNNLSYYIEYITDIMLIKRFYHNSYILRNSYKLPLGQWSLKGTNTLLLFIHLILIVV